MIKKLRDIVEKYPSDYEQKTIVGRSFVAMHRDGEVIDKLGPKGEAENQFKAGNVKVADHPRQSDDAGFPGEGEYNDYNLRTYYDKSDAGGSDEYDDDDFEYDDNDVDNDETRSRIANDEEYIEEDKDEDEEKEIDNEETELDENKGPDYGPINYKGKEIGWFERGSANGWSGMHNATDFRSDMLLSRGEAKRQVIAHHEELLKNWKKEQRKDKREGWYPAMGEEIGRLTFPQLMEKWEQIDEISKTTAARYAQGSHEWLRKDAAKQTQSKDDLRRGVNRQMGVFRAVSKFKGDKEFAAIPAKGGGRNLKLRYPVAPGHRLSEEEIQIDEMMTRKHFRSVANTVRAIEDPKKRWEYASHHVEIFAKDNPRFDRQKFFDAAGTRNPLDISTSKKGK